MSVKVVAFDVNETLLDLRGLDRPFVVIEPGHDAWTVGDEACVVLDTGVGAYAKPS